MSELARLAGGVLCVGVSGEIADSSLLDDLHELGPAGVVLFERNTSTPDRTRALVGALRGAIGGDAPALVALDQEGGNVRRLRNGAAPIPSMMALAATADVELARRVGAALAFDLRRIGANVDFAPVLDLALESASTVIGTRAFGDDPKRVATFGSALAQGLEAGGVVATLKHFPGHGATARDSHHELPVVDVDAATLRKRDLVPFAAGIAAGARAVMTAHVVVRAFDAELPATLSRRVLTDLLRDELGFDGVCFTDALEMDAIAATVGIVEGAVRAIAAGADCVVLGLADLAVAREVRDALVTAALRGVLRLGRLEEAAARVARLRASLARELGAAGSDPNVARAVAERAITVVRGDVRLDPILPTTVVSFEARQREEAAAGRADHASLHLALRTRRVRAELLRVPLEPDEEMIEQLLALAATPPARQFVLVARRALGHSAQRHAIAALLASVGRAILVCAREPFDAAIFSQAERVVCTYGDEEPIVAALADVLTGRLVPAGVLPVALERAST